MGAANLRGLEFVRPLKSGFTRKLEARVDVSTVAAKPVLGRWGVRRI